ncbi:MAG: hypothetical protein GYA24_21540 [Candidatus Lokiarchaeota archaeon]|nr:hypothetical protein [Candidatus Lokiarchaeota archaeon]
MVEVHSTMALNPIPELLVLAMLGAMAFASYVLCFVAWHHLRIRQKSSRLLLVHDILELVSLTFIMFGFLASLQYLLPFFLGLDFAIAAWICFDELYAHFFSDKPRHESVATKPVIVLFIFWAFSHYIVIIYDGSRSGEIRYTIPGLLFLGVAMVVHILRHEMILFRGQLDHVKIEVDRVEPSDKWKVELVSKQYKFLHLQFPVHAGGYIILSIGLIIVMIDGLTLLAATCFCAAIMLLMVGKGCQLIGFLHPVPQWKAAIEGK